MVESRLKKKVSKRKSEEDRKKEEQLEKSWI